MDRTAVRFAAWRQPAETASRQNLQHSYTFGDVWPLLTLAGLCIAIPVAVSLGYPTFATTMGGLYLVSILIRVVILPRYGDRLFSSVGSKRLRSFAIDNDLEDWFPVRMSISQEDRLTGKDEGLVHFEDGLLVFRGLRTEFAVLPNKVSDSEWSDYSFVDSGITVRVTLTPFDKLSHSEPRQRDVSFRKNLKQW